MVLLAKKANKSSFIDSMPNLLTVRQFAEKHRFISEAALRNHIFYADSNGLKNTGALVRLGRRVLLDEEKFFNWIDQQQ